jgi:hypothetical protein
LLPLPPHAAEAAPTTKIAAHVRASHLLPLTAAIKNISTPRTAPFQRCALPVDDAMVYIAGVNCHALAAPWTFS